jgi:hypothetical protein
MRVLVLYVVQHNLVQTTTFRAVDEVPPTAKYVNRLSLQFQDVDSATAGGGVSGRGGMWKSNSGSGCQSGL